MPFQDGRVKMFNVWTKSNDAGNRWQSYAPAPTFDEAVALLASTACNVVGYANTRRREGKNDPNSEVWVIPKRG